MAISLLKATERKIGKKALEHFDIDNIIMYCGSSVTTCHTLLAMAQAGLEMPQLYEGSWSEWSVEE